MSMKLDGKGILSIIKDAKSIHIDLYDSSRFCKCLNGIFFYI